MQIRSLVAAAALLGAAHGSYIPVVTNRRSSPPLTAAAVDVQVVYVGMNPATNTTGLKYWPEKITAAPGTMVQFQFLAGKHTITLSIKGNQEENIPDMKTMVVSAHCFAPIQLTRG